MRGETFEQSSADPAAVKVVCDRERDLCPMRIVQPHVRGKRDGPCMPVRIGELAEERAPRVPIRLECTRNRRRTDRRGSVKTEVTAVG